DAASVRAGAPSTARSTRRAGTRQRVLPLAPGRVIAADSRPATLRPRAHAPFPCSRRGVALALTLAPVLVLGSVVPAGALTLYVSASSPCPGTGTAASPYCKIQ